MMHAIIVLLFNYCVTRTKCAIVPPDNLKTSETERLPSFNPPISVNFTHKYGAEALPDETIKY